MCRLLGLISEDMHKLLKQFFTFRNHHFAHAHAEIKLSDNKIASALDRLLSAVPSDFRRVITTEDARNKYIMVVVILYYILNYDYHYWDDYGV